MKPYLGDTGDADPPIYVARMRRERLDFVRLFIHIILAVIAGCAFMVLLVMFVILSLQLFSRPARANGVITPQSCIKLAERYGATAPGTFSREQAEQVLAHLGVSMILVPEARACRRALKKELKQ